MIEDKIVKISYFNKLRIDKWINYIINIWIIKTETTIRL